MKKIRVLFFSVQPIITSLFANMFHFDTNIAAEFTNFQEHISKDYKNYNVLFFDDGSLNNEEAKTLNAFVSDNNDNKKILYTSFLEKQYIQNTISTGINCIISKKIKLERIKDIIIKVNNGEKYYDENIVRFLFDSQSLIRDKINFLTKREKEVLILIGNRLTNIQIANKLSIHVHTVEIHKENIKRKMGIKHTKDIFTLN